MGAPASGSTCCQAREIPSAWEDGPAWAEVAETAASTGAAAPMSAATDSVLAVRVQRVRGRPESGRPSNALRCVLRVPCSIDCLPPLSGDRSWPGLALSPASTDAAPRTHL